MAGFKGWKKQSVAKWRAVSSNAKGVELQLATSLSMIFVFLQAF
jgi:hypothetical protein